VTYRSSFDRLDSLRNNFERILDELGGRNFRAGTDEEPQAVPINVFETENELMVVAAMPGLEADNIDIRAEDDYLTIRAEKRGPGQERHRYLRREWSYGPYERTIELPMDVDVERANATYGNGIVTIALPKSVRARARKIDIALEPTGTARGERVGHRGTAEAAAGTRGKEPISGRS
jgi:HSP20 family protein